MLAGLLLQRNESPSYKSREMSNARNFPVEIQIKLNAHMTSVSRSSVTQMYSRRSNYAYVSYPVCKNQFKVTNKNKILTNHPANNYLFKVNNRDTRKVEKCVQS